MIIKVKVFPDAPKNSIERKDQRIYIFTRSPANQNQANVSSRKMLASFLEIEVEKIRLISGHRNQNKTFEILS